MTQTSTAVKYQSDSISFSCYENEIPPFVEAEMERLYGSLYSSIPQLRVGGNLDGVSTYVVQKGRELVTIFLFRIDGRRLEVLNEVIRIEEEDIRRFATYIFSGFGAIDVVSFHAIQMDFGSIPFKYQQFECLEDIVVPLPGNTEDYTASLGRSTRKNLRYYRNALMHAFPSFRFSIYEKGAIEPQHVRDIIDLNRARMADKNIVSGIDEAEAAKLNYLARERGLVVVATIDGHVCAGAITFRVGENFFLSVLAHDPAYNAYRLGNQCCYFTICECIKRAGKEFHFLWGQYDYKYLFLGVQRDLHRLAIYRSRLRYLLNAGFALRIAFLGYIRRAKIWSHQDTTMSKFSRRIINTVRGFRQFRKK